MQTQNKINENNILSKKSINGAIAVLEDKISSMLQKNNDFIKSKTPTHSHLRSRLKSKYLNSTKSNFVFYNEAILKEAHITNI